MPHGIIIERYPLTFSSFRYLPKLEINIVLKNNNYLSIFYHYCLSLIAKTKGLESSSDIFNAILSTINEWSEFFKKANASKLSPNEQKGLIGELSLLSHFIDKAGINSALGSWRGPISSSKDFIFDSTAFEVKCCEPSLASSDIKISSLDQLLIKPYKNLYLVIYEIAPGSAQSENSFT